jgi:hypothetical protein
MNTKDIEIEAPLLGDKLENIFSRQVDLMAHYHSIEDSNGLLLYKEIPVDLHDRLGQARLRELIRRTTDELSEASHTLKNSPWKQSHVLTDVDHFYEEIADAFHFFIEFCIAAGLTAEDLYRIYFKKSEVNLFRQESRY